MKLTLELIKKTLDHFSEGNKLRDMPSILMAPDVFNEVLPVFDEWFSLQKYCDPELPEGHIRLIGRTRHGEVKLLSRVRSFEIKKERPQ